MAVDGSITEYTSSNTAGTKLKSQTGWYSNGNGTDAFGFSALPAGNRNIDWGHNGEGYGADFWSSTEDYSYYAYLDDIDKDFGFSVRCLKD